MFKQIKSAIFWTLVYKFKKRLSIVAVLLSIVLLSQWIYGDIVEYLQLTNRLQYLDILLPAKWIIILFNIGLSVYLLLTIFKKESLQEEKKPLVKKSNPEQKEKAPVQQEEKFTDREKEFLTKKLRSEAEILMDRE